MKFKSACLLLLAATTVFSSVFAADAQLSTYQLVLLKMGPNAVTAGTPEGQQIIKQHVEHLYVLGEQHIAAAAGPFLDRGDIQGILLMPASTPEQALAIGAADPAVRAGIFVMEALPLWLQKNAFGTWGEQGHFERLYFGFLLRGPNRSQDAKAAEELQRLHIAHMEEQAAQGALVSAGPFESESNLRGIVVYRVASEEEARRRAEVDPMIKAGRLKVELHPWQVPVGAFLGTGRK